ncbi:MAG: aminotransferase class I/II-fold pyridoxal phosphate-dependent enzyme [Spirochaetaceae bacterium]|jgi:histidinol-phosphate aminotransferase|nr:aminotransferase class I/II-fold pyridoxal phosphate-dependent enzyme [Spirochaetaceae bacterium]
MSIYWNKRVYSLRPYIPGEQPKGAARIIKLNTNENPYPPPPEVIEAISKAAGRLRLYPDPASTELREALSAKFNLDPKQIFAGNGSDEVLAFAFAAFFPSGAEENRGLSVLFPDVTYSFYPVFASLWDVQYKTIPLRDDFSLSIDDYRLPCAGAIFPNPNAPTSLALAVNEIAKLAAYLQEQRRVLIVDEAYIDFGAESAAPYIERFDNLLVVRTFSKSASLAGLRVGYALGQRPLIEGLERIRDSFNSYPVDALAAAGAAAAVKADAYYTAVNAKITATRERVSAALGAMGWQMPPSKANFIFARPPLPDGNDGAKPLFEALRKNGILTRYFPGERTKNFLRISMGTEDDMNRFLEVCEKLLK